MVRMCWGIMDYFTCIAVLLLTSSAFGKPATGNVHKFNKTTAFTYIATSNDLSIRDAVYMTPNLLFVGKSNGEIRRCLYKNPSVCEMFFYSKSVAVTDIVIGGEYLYASLADGVMLRCKLQEKHSCVNHYSSSYAMNSLVISAGYIYAGLQDGRMLRCETQQPNACNQVNYFKEAVTSLGATDEFIYAGLESAEMWRCSISSDNSCRLIHTAGSTIIAGMTAIGNTIVGISQGGVSWNCTQNECLSENVPGGGYTSMSVFDGSMYIMQDSNISRCDWEWGQGRNCVFFEPQEGAKSMYFSYSTYKMQDRYVNEEKTCLSSTTCPPYVVYYKINERPMLEVFVKEGRLYNSEDVLVDTRNADVGHSGKAAIFAMGPDGQILLSKIHNPVLRTSSLFAGNPVAGAGEMVVEDGVIKSIRACSEHYQADVELNEQVITVLRWKGYTDRIDNLPCTDNDSQVAVEDNTVRGSYQ